MFRFDPIKTQKAMNAVRKLPPDLRGKAYVTGIFRFVIYFCSFILVPLLMLSLRGGDAMIAVAALSIVIAVLFAGTLALFLFRTGPTVIETAYTVAAAIIIHFNTEIRMLCLIDIGFGILSILTFKRCFKFIADEYERGNKGGSK